MQQIALGTKVKDTLTGFEGILTSRCEYMFAPGATRFQVAVENATTERWFGEERLVAVQPPAA